MGRRWHAGQALIIETLGPSGVGKSTILKAAVEAQDVWLSAQEAEASIGKPPSEMTREAIDNYPVPGFTDRCLRIIATSTMLPSQKVSCTTIFRKSCVDALHLARSEITSPIVHDELLLHRAISILPYATDFEADTRWFFGNVGLPDGAIIFTGSPDTILDRISQRARPVNIYYGLDERGARDIIQRSLDICEIAADRLSKRGLRVKMVDIDCEISAGASLVNDWIAETIIHNRVPDSVSQ